MSTNILVDLRRATKVYQTDSVAIPALREVSVAVEEGEFVAIMGASGSGKSTLMNILGCLDRPSSGEYWLAGRDVSKLTKNELADVRGHLIGFVFQNFNLLPRTSAQENVELPLNYRACPARERHQRAKAALERIGLGERLHHHPNQLSGGQQQRVAIARALVTSPRLIMADEPTGNLDSRTSLDIMALFQELNDQGLTIILVTHEPDIAEYAKRVLVLRDGLLKSDIRQAPKRAVPQPADSSEVTP